MSFSLLLKFTYWWSAWLAQLVGYETIDLRAVKEPHVAGRVYLKSCILEPHSWYTVFSFLLSIIIVKVVCMDVNSLDIPFLHLCIFPWVKIIIQLPNLFWWTFRLFSIFTMFLWTLNYMTCDVHAWEILLWNIPITGTAGSLKTWHFQVS